MEELSQSGNGPRSAGGLNRQPQLTASPKILRDLRRARKLTQLGLATAAGVSERTVRAAESGKRVRLSSLELIAGALGAGLSDVAADSGQLITARIANQQIDRILEALGRYVSDFDTGGFDDTLAQDAVIEVMGDSLLPFGGLYRGADGVQRICELARSTIDYLAPPDIGEVRAGGDFVILRGVDHIRCRANERVDRLAWQHVYEFGKGRVVRVIESFDTLTAYRLTRESNAEYAARQRSINGKAV